MVNCLVYVNFKRTSKGNLKYSHLKLAFNICIQIAASKYNRNMILVSKHTCLRSKIALDIFSTLHP